MRKKVLSLVISFETTVEAIKMEEVCKKVSFDGRIIPLPEVISAGCGLALKCKVEDRDEVVRIMEDNNVRYDKLTEVMMWELS